MRSSNVTATSNCLRQACHRCGALFTPAFRCSICAAVQPLSCLAPPSVRQVETAQEAQTRPSGASETFEFMRRK